jgi:UDP-glucose 4-epimerase
MKHVLVTGGLGFIGSHLAGALLADEQLIVHVVDNLATNLIPKEEIVAAITRDKPGKVEIHLCSVDEFETGILFQEIYHLASVVGPAAVLEHAGEITEQIVRDTYRMIRLARRCSARLVDVSTSEVYGGGKDGYCHEQTPRIMCPRASARLEYAAGKLAAEVAIENLCGRAQLDAVIIRPFNVSGVRQLGTGGFVLPRFVGQAIFGEPLTVFGDGNQIRAFTDVRDVVSGILVAAAKGESGGVYNVGNPANRIRIRDLAERVLKVTRSKSEIMLVDPRTIYGKHYVEAANKYPDARRLTALGWGPRYQLDETIRAVHESMRALPLLLCRRVAGLEY